MLFREPEVCIEDALAILTITKIVYDETGEVTSSLIDSDYFPDVYYEALYDVGDEIGAGEYNYDDYVTKYCFPQMYEYYELCREYGKKNKIAFKNNPFVKEAAMFVDSEMRGIDSYCIDWKLIAPQKIVKKKYPCLAVFTTAEFYQPVQLVDSLYNIRSYYRLGVDRIKKELEKTQAKILLLPKANEERKNAA